MKRSIVLAVFVAAACAAPSPRTQAQWRPTNDRPEPLEQAKPACKSYALEKTKNVTGGLAAKATVGAFAECMYERGWSLSESEAP